MAYDSGMSLHSHINQFEQFIIRNKMVVTILTATALIVSMPMYMYTLHTGKMAYCVRVTDESINAMVEQGETVDHLYAIRRGYYRCIAEQGINVQTVPSYEEIFDAGPTDYEYMPFEFEGDEFFDDIDFDSVE